MQKSKNVFLGSPDISVFFLEKLKELGFTFNLIITNPDRKSGRKQILTPSPVKIWAMENKTDLLQPEKIDDDFIQKINEIGEWDTFFVLAYGKILPEKFIQTPKLGTFNLHPSLLPQYRGPSPIISAILDDQKETGISIIKLDEQMDHGPIVAQEKIFVDTWKKNHLLEKKFSQKGAELFFTTLPSILDGLVTEQPQNHDKATYCRKYHKQDMELDFPFTSLNARKNFLTYCAFPKPFFIDSNGKRNVVTQATWSNDAFVVEKIIPEGKTERDF